MDPNILSSTTPASQELIQAFPKPCLPHNVFLANKGNPVRRQGILTADLNCRLILWSTSDTCCQEKGQCSQVAAASMSQLCQSFGMDSDSKVFIIWEASEVWVSALSLYTQWCPHSFCYWHCHLRVGLFAYQPVILWLGC
jgi:hypothetical protein